jgi:hypothetical protein
VAYAWKIKERTGGRRPQARARILHHKHVPAPDDWYPLFPNPVVAESLLDRLINTSHQVFMNSPSYRPNKRPGQPDVTGKEVTR